MNNNFFLRVKEVIEQETISSKITLFKILEEDFYNHTLDFTTISDIKVFDKPSYYKICKIVDSKQIKNKKNLHEKDGIASLLHSVAHIEYSAIDLALDACYRFCDLPLAYYKDWLSVASDEIRHFQLITTLMKQYDIQYGDLPVHQGLFNSSMKSLTLIKRMALIPRYMEANGLDSNAFIISKLKKLKNTNQVVELFELILEEEIDHVKKGDIWYKYGCSLKNYFKCNYFDIVNSIQKNSFKTNKNINIDARKKAGFSDEEIAILLHKDTI
jgi:uncharacterized ferritin-like protein (DUF455 family)